jgi:hypothetical protein
MVPPFNTLYARSTSSGQGVVWVHQMRSQGPMSQSFLYGHEASGIVPTLLHPNELLDGALVGANYWKRTTSPPATTGSSAG